MPPVNNHRRGSSRLIRAPVLVVDLLTSLGRTPPPCPVTPAEYLPNQPFGAHADSCRLISTQLMHSLQKFLGLFCLHAYQRRTQCVINTPVPEQYAEGCVEQKDEGETEGRD